MDKINLGQQLNFSSRASEVIPMPRPLPVPLREEIVRRRQQGTPLTQIAAELAIPYGTVRNIWRLAHRADRQGLTPNYRPCGRPVPKSTQELLELACELKRDHPTWGAGYIRLKLGELTRRRRLPSARSLQRAFVRAGVHRARRRRTVTVAPPQAVQPHETWQVDAVEQIRLADGQGICWMTVTDEASEAMLATEISPPTTGGNMSRCRKSARCFAGFSSAGASPTTCGSTTASPGARPATCRRSWPYG